MSSDSPVKSIQDLFQLVQDGLDQKKKNLELSQHQPMTFLWSGNGSAFTFQGKLGEKGQEALAIQIQPITSSATTSSSSNSVNIPTTDVLPEKPTPNRPPVPITQTLPSNLPASTQHSLIETFDLGKIVKPIPMHVPPPQKHQPPAATPYQLRKERINKTNYELSIAQSSIKKRDEMIEDLKVQLKMEREATRSHQTFAENCRQTAVARELWWEERFRKTVEELSSRITGKPKLHLISEKDIEIVDPKRKEKVTMNAMPGPSGIMMGNAPPAPFLPYIPTSAPPPYLHPPQTLSHAELCYFSTQLFPHSTLPLPMQIAPLPPPQIQNRPNFGFKTHNPNKHSVHYQRRWAEGMKRYNGAKIYRDPKMVVLKSLFNPARGPEVPQLVQQPTDSFTLYRHWREASNVNGGTILEQIVQEWQEIVEKDVYVEWENRAKEVKEEHEHQIGLGCVTVDEKEERVVVNPYLK